MSPCKTFIYLSFRSSSECCALQRLDGVGACVAFSGPDALVVDDSGTDFLLCALISFSCNNKYRCSTNVYILIYDGGKRV